MDVWSCGTVYVWSCGVVDCGYVELWMCVFGVALNCILVYSFGRVFVYLWSG